MRSKTNPIGVMQGRLLPKYQGKYQAHPVGYWDEEFFIASKLHLDCIEFILDFDTAGENPLLSTEGIKSITSVMDDTNVRVYSICADYFMEAPLHVPNVQSVSKSEKVLMSLLGSAEKLGSSNIVLPCVDQSSLQSQREIENLVSVLKNLMMEFERKNIFLSLETDLAPTPFAKLIERVASAALRVNYDIGNSASLGFCPKEEFEAYGPLISDCHIKDRIYRGGSVKLGDGCADFDYCLSELRRIKFDGPLIMQAYRDDDGLDIFHSQLEWFHRKWDATLAG